MIRVLSLSIYKAKESTRLFYESYKFKEVNPYYFEKWKSETEIEYAQKFGCDVKAYVTRRLKPNQEIDMMAVLINTANVMGQDITDIISKSRKREFVDVRKTTCMILTNLDYSPMRIEEGLPFKHRLVYRYVEAMENRFITEPGYIDKFEDIEKEVNRIIFLNKKPNKRPGIKKALIKTNKQ